MSKSKFVRDRESFRAFYQYIEECGLLPEMQSICVRHAVTIHDVYMDAQGASVTAARIEAWWCLMARYGKSPAEVGRIFNRDRSSIMYAMRKLQERANALDVMVAEDTVTPLAKKIAAQSLENRRAVGVRLAQTRLGVEAIRRRGREG